MNSTTIIETFNYFSYDRVFNYIALFLGIVGFIVAIKQLKKIKKSTIAAQEAANQTREQINSRIFILEITKCSIELKLIIELLRSHKYEATVYQIENTQNYISQYKSFYKDDQSNLEKLQNILVQLKDIRNKINKYLYSDNQSEKKLETSAMINKISDLNIQINEIIGNYN